MKIHQPGPKPGRPAIMTDAEKLQLATFALRQVALQILAIEGGLLHTDGRPWAQAVASTLLKLGEAHLHELRYMNTEQVYRQVPALTELYKPGDLRPFRFPEAHAAHLREKDGAQP